LPADHAEVTRIQFLYGSLIAYFRPLREPGEQASFGYVLFTYGDGSRQYIDVAASDGGLTAAEPLPYPVISAGPAQP